MIPLARPDIGPAELRSVTAAVTDGWISGTGPAISAFEAALAARTARRYVVVTNSGTSALELALRALNIGPGDEVLVPAFTFAAPALTVLAVGARPVLVDVDPETWNIDAADAHSKLTHRTGAIIAVDLMGSVCDYAALSTLGVPIIEDAAQAHGALGPLGPAGSHGLMSIFSFHANKTVTTGEGGCVGTDAPDLGARLRLIANHGMTPERPYHHDVVGRNYRMTNVTAALGIAQAERWEELVGRRRALSQQYYAALEDFGDRRSDLPGAVRSSWLHPLRTKNRDEFVAHLLAREIDARAVWEPLSTQPLINPGRSSCPVTEALAGELLWIPTASCLRQDEVERVIDACTSWVRGRRGETRHIHKAETPAGSVDVQPIDAVSVQNEPNAEAELPRPARVAVLGGCGRVGLPLSVALAATGVRVEVVDIDAAAVARVAAGQAVFGEPQMAGPLAAAVRSGALRATTDMTTLSGCDAVVIAVGTPRSECASATSVRILRLVEDSLPYLRSGCLVVLRSTIQPGGTAAVERLLAPRRVSVAYCPERLAEGRAMQELRELPQLIGARDNAVAGACRLLFGPLGGRQIVVTPEEAELAKLFSNVWRYIKFAAANQFWTMAHDLGLDFGVVRAAMMWGYRRNDGLPPAGFAAGPCLVKDTLLLGPHARHGTYLGNAALSVNQRLPQYLGEDLARRYDPAGTRVGILGMAYKGDVDDPRDSLAYSLRDTLLERGFSVSCSDPFVAEPGLAEEGEVVSSSDVLVIGAPHSHYRSLVFPGEVIDLFGVLASSAAMDEDVVSGGGMGGIETPAGPCA